MVTVHAISRLGIETTGVEISLDSCLIAIDAAQSGGQAGEKEKIAVKVVHHKVPWLEEVSSSLVRTVGAAEGVDLSGLVDKKEGHDDTTHANVDAQLKGLLDERVLQYIKEHGLYGYNSSFPATHIQSEEVKSYDPVAPK
jgi:hypothetical protein